MTWRNFASKKRRAGLSMMTTISFLGVTIGVAVLVVVLSIMGGLEENLRKKMFLGLPHFEIVSENVLAGFSLLDYPMSTFKKAMPDAVRLEPYIRSDVVLRQKRHLASASLFGIDPQLGGRLWGFGNAVVEGSMQSLLTKHASAYDFEPNPRKWPGIILGDGLAGQLGVGVGELINVLSPQAGIQDALSGSTISSHFVVTGIFRTDLSQFDSKYAIVNLDEGRRFMSDYDESLDEEAFVSGVAINFAAPENVDQYTQLGESFKGLRAVTWKTVNKALLFALKLEKFTMGAILLLIVLVAAFSISGTMMMTVFHKRQQIALMRALGMTRADIAKLFVIHGFFIGTVGIILGLLFGVGVCVVLYYFIDDMVFFFNGLVEGIVSGFHTILEFFKSLYFGKDYVRPHQVSIPSIDYGLFNREVIPVKFLPWDYLVISLCAWFLSLVAALYPALVASRQDPGAGLRCR
jgi:lipoprotein-releasing system permease protein